MILADADELWTYQLSIREGEKLTFLFSPTAIHRGNSVNFVAEGDLLLHIIVRQDDHVLVLNDCLSGVWGKELSLPLPVTRARTLRVDVEFGAKGLRICIPGTEPLAIDDRFTFSGPVQARIPPAIVLRDGGQSIELDDLRGLPGDAVDDDIGETGAVIGYVDYFADAPGLGGVIIGGWVSTPWTTNDRSLLLIDFAEGIITTPIPDKVLVAWHERADLGDMGVGFVLFVPGDLPPADDGVTLKRLRLRLADGQWHDIVPSPGVGPGPEMQAVQAMRDLLHKATGKDLSALRALLRRPVYTGVDTLGPLGLPIHIEVDEVIEVRTGAAFLLGWQLDPQDLVEAVHLRSGTKTSDDLAATTMRVARNDIVEAFSNRYGITDNRVGFMAYGETHAEKKGPLHLEIRLRDGKIAFKPLPFPSRAGVAAIRRVLGAALVPADEMQRVFDTILGPAVLHMNKRRLSRPMAVSQTSFGTLPSEPRASLVIPLYGRLDFMRYQLALFSAGGLEQDEVIYVLDEPGRKEELLHMAHSAFGSFRYPFRIVMPSENVGFGPASNLGMQHAHGRYICFLNSDVFPADTHFFDHLVEDLEADPRIGCSGGRLLFADGSVQHAAMDYEPLPELGNWLFPMHPGKGRYPKPDLPRLQRARAITGACMMLSRTLALELGGFDPNYVIGDFEDADLCQRIAERGLICAVDNRARAYHLERQSQGDSANIWRRNVTLLNAWTFNTRYRDALTVPAASSNRAPE